MEEEGERRRRGISAYDKRRRPPTQSSKSSSPSQGTSASLRCCAGGAATRVNNLSFSPEMKQELPIWRRKERGEGEERTGKSLLEGEVRFDSSHNWLTKNESRSPNCASATAFPVSNSSFDVSSFAPGSSSSELYTW